MLAGCGHIEIDVAPLRVLGSMVDKAWCQICQEWRDIWRPATINERVGIVVVPLPDECPF